MSIVDFIYPKICVGCRKEGQYICSDCQKKLIKPMQICPMCCRHSIDGWTHLRCKHKEGLDRLIIGLPYRGLVQNCLKNVKYRGGWDVIAFLYNLCDFGEVNSCVVASVPMWREKERERGFNQAQLIGKLFAKKSDNPYIEALMRTRITKPMFGLNIDDRKINVSGAFEISTALARELVGKKLILIDDVWTTGATIRECTKVLKRNGVDEVWGLTLAW